MKDEEGPCCSGRRFQVIRVESSGFELTPRLQKKNVLVESYVNFILD